MEKTLNDEEYIRLGELAAAEVRRYITDLSSWSNLSSKNGMEVGPVVCVPVFFLLSTPSTLAIRAQE